MKTASSATSPSSWSKEVIERILRHIGEDPHPPRVLPARSPPQLAMPFAQTTGPVTWPEMDQTAEYPQDF